MKLIIGLGNPGKKYAHTRHNIGFLMADKLQKEWNFPKFIFSKKFNAEISGGKSKIKNQKSKILLVKPWTFMNNSGQAVKQIMKFYKIKSEDIIVIHDDLDIDLGKFKISEDSRSAGHNGVQSIIDNLRTQNFKRIRIGIEGEEKRKKRLMPSEDFVLQNFTRDEKNEIKNILDKIIISFPDIL